MMRLLGVAKLSVPGDGTGLFVPRLMRQTEAVVLTLRLSVS